jgi:hypothetical protein
VTAPTPTIPSFVDGMVVHQGELNALAANLTNLYSYNQGGFRTQRPAVFARQTTPQPVPNATDTLVTFQSASINTANMYVPSQPDRITVQQGGVYLLFSQVRWPSVAGANLTQRWTANILVNGTAVANAVAFNTHAMVAEINGQGMVTMANLAAGATVYSLVQHNAGSSQLLGTDRGSSFLAAVFLTPSA